MIILGLQQTEKQMYYLTIFFEAQEGIWDEFTQAFAISSFFFSKRNNKNELVFHVLSDCNFWFLNEESGDADEEVLNEFNFIFVYNEDMTLFYSVVSAQVKLNEEVYSDSKKQEEMKFHLKFILNGTEKLSVSDFIKMIED